MTQLRNVRYAAQALHITPRAVLHRIDAGTLVAHKLGTGRTSSWVITDEEIARQKALARQPKAVAS